MILAALFGASVFFGVQGERRRGEVQRAGASVQTDHLVSLASVTDGDSIVVTNPSGEAVAVRIIGVKAMEGAPGKDPVGIYAVEVTQIDKSTLFWWRE